MNALAPKGMCDCRCHVIEDPSMHARACCELSGLPLQRGPKPWKRPKDGWGPRSDDGRQECDVCGKHQFPAIHSCGGFPKTEAARARWEDAGRDAG